MQDHLHTEHDFWMVAIAIAVAIYASFASINVANRIVLSRGGERAGWIAAAAFALGGGIWSMHFIAMLAFRSPAPLSFDLVLTLVSLAIAVGLTAIGFVLASRPGTQRLQVVWAGIVMGLGVAAMHYTGMAAVQTPVHVGYDIPIVMISVAIAVVAATAALHIALEWTTMWHQIIAAVVMGGAIASMHFTAMAAVTLSGDVSSWNDAGLHDSSRSTLGIFIAIGISAILTIGLVSVLFERRVARVSATDASAMQRSERRMKALLRNLSDLVLLLDSEGVVIYAAAGMLGLEPGDLERWRATDVIVHGDREPFRAAMALAIADGRSQGEVRAVSADGVEHTLEFTMRNFLEDPDIKGIVVSFHDVTARKAVESELRHAKEAAELVNRTKTQILTNMSHELRTPLNAVIGFSEMIAGEALGPIGLRRYVDYAQHINRSGTLLLRLLNDILDAAKLEAGEIALYEEVLDLARIVESAVAQAEQAAARQHVTFVCETAELPPMLGDAKCLARMLDSLLDNAIKFTPAGGGVTLKTRFTAGEGYCIEVTDTGIGIAPHMLKKVREPFVQADGSLTRKYEGAGLGLTIATAFAALHGGSLEIASELGRGTEVTVRLPVERVVWPGRQVA